MKPFELLKESNYTGSDKTRDEAIRLGITVAEVKRNAPVYARNMRSLALLETSVIKYSTARNGSDNAWVLLQRLPSYGSNMPNNYLFESTGAMPEQLLKVITQITERYDEEYFEFECSKSEVAVFWQEWGARQKAIELHALLNKLAVL